MLPALIGLTAAAAASAAGYQSMAPTGQWFGRTFAGGVRGSKQIALTYDDGPNDPHTLKLLDVLAKHGVRATFFMIGRYVRQRPEIVNGDKAFITVLPSSAHGGCHAGTAVVGTREGQGGRAVCGKVGFDLKLVACSRIHGVTGNFAAIPWTYAP